MILRLSGDSSPAVKAVCSIVNMANIWKQDGTIEIINGKVMVKIGDRDALELPDKLYKPIITAVKVNMGFEPQIYFNDISGEIEIEDKDLVRKYGCTISAKDSKLIIHVLG